MESKYGDFWDRVAGLHSDAFESCSQAVEAGELSQFENDWLDPSKGMLSKFTEHPWFVDAKEIAKKLAAENIRREIQEMVDNYRLDERLLDADFG